VPQPGATRWIFVRVRYRLGGCLTGSGGGAGDDRDDAKHEAWDDGGTLEITSFLVQETGYNAGFIVQELVTSKIEGKYRWHTLLVTP
jgi:hypothetical protein